MCKHHQQPMLDRHNDSNPRPCSALQPEALEKVLAELQQSFSPDISLAAFLSAGTGMRIREVVQLPWSAIDFENNQVHVPVGKDGAKRSITMTRAVALVLKPLFETKSNDRVINCGYQSLSSRLNRALCVSCARLGIAPMKAQSLRKSFAFRVASAGISSGTLQHRRIETSCNFS